MTTTLAFDIYGTLVDTHGVVKKLETLIGDKANAFSTTWRDKQLEYSFRRGLMQDYQTFATCIANALDYTCEYHQALISIEDKKTLLACYRALPAFADVEPALQSLQQTDFKLYAFSNGKHNAINSLLTSAKLNKYFIDVISVDDVQSFKPDPKVYKHFLNKAESIADNTWLISSNPFDVIGALNAGLKAVWVKRSEQALFDPWGIQPSHTINKLSELSSLI